jgi:hypothetical protein
MGRHSCTGGQAQARDCQRHHSGGRHRGEEEAASTATSQGKTRALVGLAHVCGEALGPSEPLATVGLQALHNLEPLCRGSGDNIVVKPVEMEGEVLPRGRRYSAPVDWACMTTAVHGRQGGPQMEGGLADRL